MYNLDAIEAINVDQLVTPLDRLLLRSGQLRRTRRSTDLTNEAAFALAASAKRAEAQEQTVYMRAASRVNVFTAAAVRLRKLWRSCASCLLA